MLRLTSIFLFSLFLFISGLISPAKAQTKELLGGNVLNGAITGTMLGAATMGLQNSNDFTPLRIGLGAGILSGAGIAAYDMLTLPRGQQFYISGIFNDGRNSSIIILLDTIYGAAGGAILGSAVMLIANEPIVDGLQYGSGVGAWTGFGLGLLDSFFIAERNKDFVSQKLLNRNSLIEFDMDNMQLGMMSPSLVSYKDISGSTLSIETNLALNILSFKARF